VIPLFAFSEDIRRIIYTTNAIESVNMTLRKVTRNHRIFPSDEAVYKVVYLAMRNLARKWTMPIHDWKPALNRFALEFAGRFPDAYSNGSFRRNGEQKQSRAHKADGK
jgi:putative transposase